MDRKHNVFAIPVTLISCTAVSILSTDLYTPSMPHLLDAIGTTDNMVQLTLSINFFAYAIAQLFHGPIADRFGARHLLISGMLGLFCTSLVCALAINITGLLAGRFFQGIFSSVPGVVVVMLIRQYYKDTAAVKILGIHGMAIGLAPALGPMLGGYLFVLAGWRSSFWTIAVLSLVLLAMILKLLPAAPVKSGQRLPLRTYANLCTNLEFMKYTISLAAVFGALFAFVTAGPFLFLQRFDVATESYGIYYGCVIAAFIAGNFITTALIDRISVKKLASIAIVVAGVGSLLLILLTFVLGETLLAIMAGLEWFALGLGLLMASGYTCLMNEADDNQAGVASAVAGSTQLAAAGIASALVSYLNDGTAWPMIIVIAGFCLFAAFIQFGLKSAINKAISNTS